MLETAREDLILHKDRERNISRSTATTQCLRLDPEQYRRAAGADNRMSAKEEAASGSIKKAQGGVGVRGDGGGGLGDIYDLRTDFHDNYCIRTCNILELANLNKQGSTLLRFYTFWSRVS